jgi:hypothetical protein
LFYALGSCFKQSYRLIKPVYGMSKRLDSSFDLGRTEDDADQDGGWCGPCVKSFHHFFFLRRPLAVTAYVTRDGPVLRAAAERFSDAVIFFATLAGRHAG